MKRRGAVTRVRITKAMVEAGAIEYALSYQSRRFDLCSRMEQDAFRSISSAILRAALQAPKARKK